MSMAKDGNQDYSTLEAVQYHPVPDIDTSKQVVPEDGKVAYDPHSGIEVVTKPGSNEYGGNLPKYTPSPETEEHTPRSRNKRKWIIIGSIIAVVVLGAVLGGVLGSVLGKSKSSTSSTPGAATPTATSTGAVPTGTATVNQSKYNLAAISFVNAGVNATRVYYQNSTGGLMEAATSESSLKWSNHKLGFSGMNGSAIAAAVSPAGFTLEISVFYTDSNYLIHDIVYNHSTSTWGPGIISAKGYVTLSNGSITALYDQCKLCGNTTLVAFQDLNGFIQVANKTSSGWSLSQLDIAATEGTGLAMQPFYRSGQPNQINLYHQKASTNLSLASYKNPKTNNGVFGWSTSEQIYLEAPYGTPIAASSSYLNGSSGLENWIELLSLSSRGIQVDTWTGATNDWASHETHPSAMSNSTTNPKIFGSMAMTSMGSAYAVIESSNGTLGIGSWQVADDYTNWEELGEVSIGSVWS